MRRQSSPISILEENRLLRLLRSGKIAGKTDEMQSQINAELISGQAQLEQDLQNGLSTKQDIITAVVTSEIEENGGTPTVDSSFENGQLNLEFKNLKGEKGETGATGATGATGPQGDSVLVGQGDLPLAHVLGQDNTKAISQKGVTDAIWDSITLKAKKLSIYNETLNPDGEITKAGYNIVRSTGNFNTNNGKKHGILPVRPGEKYIFRSLIDPENIDDFDDYCCYAFSNTASFSKGGTVPILEGTSIGIVAPLEYVTITIPEGCSHLLLSNDGKATSTVVFTIKWEIWRTHDDEDLDKLEQKFGEETENITQQIENLTNLRYYDFNSTDIENFPYGAYLQNSGKFGKQNSNYAAYHFSKDISITMRGKHLRLTPQEGKSVRCAFLITNKPKAKRNQYFSIEQQGSVRGETDEVLDLVVPIDTEYVYIQQLQSGDDVRPARIEVYEKSSLEDLRKFSESIIDFIVNDEGSIKSIVRQALWVADDMSGKPSPLALLHYSDIHGTNEAAQKILQYIDILNEYIDDVLCTGDSADYLSDVGRGRDWWVNQSGLAENSLFVLGNHDGATANATEYDTKDNGYAWDGKGQQWDFDNYFAPFIEDWEVMMPDGYDDPTNLLYYKACYWHKDYSEQKIRLIGLDCMHRFDGILNAETGEITGAGLKKLTNEQERWLIEKLNETLDSESDVYGWSVIVCCHYPLDDMGASSNPNKQWNDETHEWIYNQNERGGAVMSYKTSSVANFHKEDVTSIIQSNLFNLRNKIDNGYSTSHDWHDYVKGNVNNFGNIISNWITRGGKFVVWLSGHSHRDYMFYPTKFPNMLNITIDQAGNINDPHSGDRSPNTDSATCANFFVADTQNGLIKIVRLGFSMNMYLNSHRYICYDYINKKVISEG